MDTKNALKFFIYLFFALFFLMMTIIFGYILTTIDFYLPLFALNVLFLLLALLFIYLLIKNLKSDGEKKHLYFYIKFIIGIFIIITIGGIVRIKTDNQMLAWIISIIPIYALVYFMRIEGTKNTLFVDTSKVLCSYKNIRLFESKYCNENVKIGDTIVMPAFPSKNLWKMKTKKNKVVGYMYRPDIMEDFKNRKMYGIHSFTVSKIDTEGNIFIDDNIYRPMLNFSKKKEFKSKKPSPFVVNSSLEPSQTINYWVPILDDRNKMDKCTLQRKQLKLNKTSDNVKILDTDVNTNVSENEILQFCYGEDGKILLLSTFSESPVGYINDNDIVSLIKSFDDSNDLMVITVQKLQKNDDGKLDLYIKILFYK